jgi:hypothetical protein
MKVKTNKPNLIPQAATVTLPAGEYYALIKLAEGLIKERNVQLDALSVTIEDGRVRIEKSDIIPYEQDIRARVVELLVQNDDAMEALVSNDEYRFHADSVHLSTYSWHGQDLREEFPEFGKAWQAATIRLNNRAAAELVEASDEATQEG